MGKVEETTPGTLPEAVTPAEDLEVITILQELIADRVKRISNVRQLKIINAMIKELM